MDVPQNLGQRIVDAARLAVAAHLHASLDGVSNFRQRVVIGGAGPDFVTDDVLPFARRSHRLAENADGAAE